ncbi:MAG: DUF126 domain-containing protein [Lawsonibacter sp.]
MAKRFTCHKISEGKAQAEAIISEDRIMFYQIVPETGVIMEKAHAIEGESIAKKILVFPGGKGSSVVQADGLYQLNMHGNMPAAMIIQFAEPVLVSSAIIMEVPLVDKVDPAFYETVKDGDTVVVNADEGYLEILD